MGISPVIIGGAIAAAGAVGGAAISASASSSAAQTQQNAAKDANSTQIYMQQQAIAQQNQMLGIEGQLMNPNRMAGNYATQALEYALGLPQTNLSSVALPDGTVLNGTQPLNIAGTGPQAGIRGGGYYGGGQGATPGLPVASQRVGAQIIPGVNDALGGLGTPGGFQGGAGPTAATTNAYGQPIGGTPGTVGGPTGVLGGTSGGAVQPGSPLYNAQGAGAGGTPATSPSVSQLQASSPLSTLFTPFSYSASDYQQSPGYQFALGQGLEAIQNSASARGMTLSPNTEKDLAAYASGLANQDYQQAYSNAFSAYTQNQANTLNTLGSIAGYGNTAATGLGNAAVSTGANNANLTSQLGSALGANTIGAGNAAAAGQIGSANALSGGLQSLGNIYTQSQMLNNLNAGSYGFTMPSNASAGGYGYTTPSYGLGSGLNYNLNQ